MSVQSARRVCMAPSRLWATCPAHAGTTSLGLRPRAQTSVHSTWELEPHGFDGVQVVPVTRRNNVTRCHMHRNAEITHGQLKCFKLKAGSNLLEVQYLWPELENRENRENLALTAKIHFLTNAQMHEALKEVKEEGPKTFPWSSQNIFLKWSKSHEFQQVNGKTLSSSLVAYYFLPNLMSR